MRDRDDIPLETAEGPGSGGGIGDRLVVALAALALLGGVLILVGKGLGADRHPSASSSPHPSSAASGIAQASPTPGGALQVIPLQQGPVPSAEPESPQPFTGWIRLERQLPLYQDATASEKPIGSLAKGALAFAEEQPDRGDGVDWMQIDVPSPNGFIAAGMGRTLFVHRYLATPAAYGGGIGGIAAGPRGFVAWGNSGTRSNQQPMQFVAASANGRTWQAADHRPFGGAYVTTVAFGPAGWIAVGILPTNGNGDARDLWMWRSSDGLTWRSLGALPTDTSQVETSLIASDGGYLLLLEGYKSRSATGEAWWSADGLAWTKAGLPQDVTLVLQHAVATRSGFYVWPDPENGPRTKATFSSDGRNWADLDPPPISGQGRVLAMGDGLLALDTSPVTGSPHAWVGTFSNGGISWSEVTVRPPRTFGLSVAASDGTTALLFGWNRTTDAPEGWAFDTGAWREVPLPTGAFGGIVPGMAVGSPAGFVALGTIMNLRADNPVFWSGTATGGWAAEPSPFVAPLGEETDLHCPDKPTDAAAFASLDIPSAVICLGDSPITFRAYAGRCDGCSGPSADVYTPAWLADPQQNQLYLSPVSEDGWSFSSRRAATLADNPAWVGKWVQVTGHFDDPASASCRWVPDPHSGGVFYSAQSVINGCRTQFVVTQIQVAPGR
jgi:hypothetical protein